MPKSKNKKKKQEKYELRNQPSAYDKAILSWVAPQTVRYDRGKIWKINMTLVVLILVIGGILYNSWTFSLAVAAFVVAYYLVHLEHPKDIEVKISKIGIKIGSRKYPYSRIKSFWLIYNPPQVKTVNFRIEGEFIQDLTVQLDGQEPEPVREVLLQNVEEMRGQNEKVTDIILRLLKL